MPSASSGTTAASNTMEPRRAADRRQDTEHHKVLLSTLPADHGERRLALGMLMVSVAFFLIAAPFAREPLGQVWAFIPIYEAALVMSDLVTALLLFGQFAHLRSRALLVLACAYLFTALITVAHGLTFPGLFTPTGLLGAGPQSTGWLYMFWHGGFPLLVAAYALHPRPGQEVPLSCGAGRAALAGVAAVLAAVAGLTLLATAGHALLPPIIRGIHGTPLAVLVTPVVWALSLVALVLLWRRRPHTVLDLWLVVVMCAWLCDIALSAMLNHGRFDLGFYAGRVYGLLAASFVMVVLLVENGRLYARLLAAYEGERREHRRVLEKTSELKQVNRDLDAFSYSVSHDLRAPLRAVDGYARMLEEDYSDRLDSEGRRLLGVVRDGSRKMGSLIEELLNFSHLGRAPLATRPVDLDALVRQAIQDLGAEHAGRRIEFVVDPLGTVEADAALLKHALANLLSNAIKYSRNMDPALIKVGCKRGPAEGDVPIYYVRDNGAGFDMRYSSKLFSVFQRLHAAEEFEGTGVGLAIVQRVINRHGGRVWADAQIGAGACFYFTLQPDPAQAEPAPDDSTSQQSHSTSP